MIGKLGFLNNYNIVIDIKVGLLAIAVRLLYLPILGLLNYPIGIVDIALDLFGYILYLFVVKAVSNYIVSKVLYSRLLIE